jgi:hypothetical protein
LITGGVNFIVLGGGGKLGGGGGGTFLSIGGGSESSVFNFFLGTSFTAGFNRDNTWV